VAGLAGADGTVPCQWPVEATVRLRAAAGWWDAGRSGNKRRPPCQPPRRCSPALTAAPGRGRAARPPGPAEQGPRRGIPRPAEGLGLSDYFTVPRAGPGRGLGPDPGPQHASRAAEAQAGPGAGCRVTDLELTAVPRSCAYGRVRGCIAWPGSLRQSCGRLLYASFKVAAEGICCSVRGACPCSRQPRQ
jgi:hypothetical protein